MKNRLLVVFLLFISYSAVAATPFQVRRDHVKVFTSPDFKKAVSGMEYFYGDTLAVDVYDARWAEITLQDGSKGYVETRNLLLATEGFGKFSAEEKIAAPLYKVTSATLVFRKPDNGSERISLPFRNHQILYDAVPVNDQWMAIPIGGGETGYVRTMYLNEMSHDEKVAMFGQKPVDTVEEQPAAGQSTAYFDGVKTGRKFVFVIIAVCVFLLLLTLYRMNHGPLRGRALGLYVNTLLVLSLLEIWYFVSQGMGGVYWFLSFDHILSTILYVAIMLFFTWIQLSAGLNLIDDTVKASVSMWRKYLWIGLGIVIGVVLSTFYRSAMGMSIDRVTYSYSFGPDTVVFQILGQLAAGMMFARNLKKRLQTKKLLFCLYYAVIAGTVISLTMGSLLIFIVFAVIFLSAALFPRDAEGQATEEEAQPSTEPVPVDPITRTNCRSCRYFNWMGDDCKLHRVITGNACIDHES